MPDAVLKVILDEPIGTISPLLHGHFAEHIGRCCVDGLWVGSESPVPNREGFRLDVLEALRALGIPILRWPGGCFADTYHWRDGIGPREKRPRTLGESCGLPLDRRLRAPGGADHQELLRGRGLQSAPAHRQPQTR